MYFSALVQCSRIQSKNQGSSQEPGQAVRCHVTIDQCIGNFLKIITFAYSYIKPKHFS